MTVLQCFAVFCGVLQMFCVNRLMIMRLSPFVVLELYDMRDKKIKIIIITTVSCDCELLPFAFLYKIAANQHQLLQLAFFLSHQIKNK